MAIKLVALRMILLTLVFTQGAVSSRMLSDKLGPNDGRSLLQTCWPGMRLNCPPNTQVECEVGGVGGCDCNAMEACLPNVSGCFIVVNGLAVTSCGF